MRLKCDTSFLHPLRDEVCDTRFGDDVFLTNTDADNGIILQQLIGCVPSNVEHGL